MERASDEEVMAIVDEILERRAELLDRLKDS
jgi:hypothetical protein